MNTEEKKRKLNFMSFQEKLNAIELIGKGKSQRKIAKELGIGRTTLYNALKNKDKILEASKKYEGTNKRRLATTKHPEIEKAVLDYIFVSRENKERITGSSIQAIALETAANLGFNDFSGSNGWLFSFFKRNNISIKELNEGIDENKKQKEINDNPVTEIICTNDDKDEEEEVIYTETLEKEDYIVIDWRSWCRLCGNVETLSEIEQDILEIIVMLLNFSFDENVKICCECHSKFQSIVEVINKSKFIENMFIELDEYEKSNYITEETINTIRDRYDINKEQPTELTEMNFDQAIVHNEEDLIEEEEVNEYENLSLIEAEELDVDTIESYNDSVEIEKNVCQDTISSERVEDIYDYKCHICSEVFSRMCFLSNHTRKLHNCLPRVACFCGRFLSTWDSLMSHKRRHSLEPRNWLCDLCDASFITKNGLSIHIKFKHQTQQALHLCTICGKEFKNAYTLKSHEKTHLPDNERLSYECEICNKKFTQRGSLKIHISSVHEGQKSILCHLCSKSFSSNHYLKIHILTHSIENVRCEICNSFFKNRISLQNHKKKMHNRTKELNFKCTECDKKFHNRNHLERHMPTHTGERNYRCNFENCNQAYKWEKDLRNHMARHKGEKKLKCMWCDRSFVDSGNLRKHKLKHHAEELASFELEFGKRRRLKDLILVTNNEQKESIE